MTHLDLLLQRGPQHGDVVGGLDEIRRTVLLDGIPANSDGTVSETCVKPLPSFHTIDHRDPQSDLRIYAWLVLLNTAPLSTDAYLDLVRQGASPAYDKIRNDTFRTLTTDPLFRRRVTENTLSRVLNAIAWKLQDAHESRVNGWMSPPTLGVPRSIDGRDGDNMFHSPASVSTRHGLGSVTGTDGSEAGDMNSVSTSVTSVGYVQGMNVMAAPFLYAARSEVEAFAGFDRFITSEVPGYVRSSMDGVHKGLAILDRLLELLDPELANHLLSKGMKAEIYAFPSVLTMCACTPPLPEVMILWDFLFAYGPQLNLLCIVAQLILAREQLLNSPSPKPDFKPLKAKRTVELTLELARRVPDDLYQEMLLHAK
jgi:cell cycle arrest protein BUB2